MLRDGKENVNIGLLGHVDCGKTSLAKTLSSQLGTACFDKSPQSQERGITLDLGFSAFEHDKFNFTVVDCPGHASLFKTVLCGAQIIDILVLVIDVAKGMQAQTAECWVLAEILAKRLVVVLNKIDSVDSQEIEKMKKKMRVFLSSSKFKIAPIVAVSTVNSVGLDDLKDALASSVKLAPIVRRINDPFVFAVDHCFGLKGQGTVLAGTVLSGQVNNKQSILIPDLKAVKKIKSIQSFKKTVNVIGAGDRAGICVTALEADGIERTLICTPEAPLLSTQFLLLKVSKVKHFKQPLQSKSRIHISVLNETCVAKQVIFVKETPFGFEYLDELSDAEGLAVVELERSVWFSPSAVVIAARLDMEPSMKQCRIAFSGTILRHSFTFSDVCIYRERVRQLQVDRVIDECSFIASKEGEKGSIASAAKMIGMQVQVFKEEQLLTLGQVTSSFGSSGKVNVSLQSPIQDIKKCQVRLHFAKVLFQEQKRTFQFNLK